MPEETERRECAHWNAATINEEQVLCLDCSRVMIRIPVTDPEAIEQLRSAFSLDVPQLRIVNPDWRPNMGDLVGFQPDNDPTLK
jgi:hypothetical protein